MTTVHKTDTRLQRSAHGAGACLFGLPFIAIGSYFALAGFEAIPLPGKANAPLWVIGLVGVAFALGGLTFAAMGLRGVLRARHLRSLGARRPDEPWWADHGWDPRGTRDSPWGRVAASGGGFVFVLIFLAPFNWWAFASGDGNAFVKGMVGFADLLVLLAGGVFVHRLLQALHHGPSQLAFRRFPFFPGEHVDVALSPNRFDTQQVTLRYIEERFVTRGHGKQRRTSQHSRELWRETRAIAAPGAPEVSIAFELPADQAQVTRMTASPMVRYYELVVEAPTSGADFRTTFELPVYARPDGHLPGPAPPPLAPLRPMSTTRRTASLGIVALALLALIYGAIEGGLPRLVRGWLAIDALAGLGRSGMGVMQGRDGAVWVLTKSELVRYPDGDADSAQPLVGGGASLRAPVAMASILADLVDGVWIGSWYGHVWLLIDGELAQISGREDGPRGRVHGFARFGGAMYVGADRLWRIDDVDAEPEPVDAVPVGRIRALHVDGERALHVGAGDTLWRFDGIAWSAVWAGGPSGVREVHAIARARSGELLIGTDAGLFALDDNTGTARSLLAAVEVRALGVARSRTWVAAWRGGLIAGDAGWERWSALGTAQGLPDDDATGVVVAADGSVWVSLYGAGAARVDGDALETLLAPRR